MGVLEDSVEEFKTMPPAGKWIVGGAVVGVAIIAIARHKASSSGSSSPTLGLAGTEGTGGGFSFVPPGGTSGGTSGGSSGTPPTGNPPVGGRPVRPIGGPPGTPGGPPLHPSPPKNPAPKPTPAPPAPAPTQQYTTIMPGDTLTSLAYKWGYGSNWHALWALNPQITNPDLIIAWKQLRVR